MESAAKESDGLRDRLARIEECLAKIVSRKSIIRLILAQAEQATGQDKLDCLAMAEDTKNSMEEARFELETFMLESRESNDQETPQ
jgi:hypothetical protein